MSSTDKIRSILLQNIHSDLNEDEKESLLHSIICLDEWENIKKTLLALLQDNDPTLWNETITFIYFFQNMGYEFEAKETIPLLYNCLSLSNDLDENLIWTITRTIKSLPYSSDYDPYNDDEMYKEIEKIHTLRKTNSSQNH